MATLSLVYFKKTLPPLSHKNDVTQCYRYSLDLESKTYILYFCCSKCQLWHYNKRNTTHTLLSNGTLRLLSRKSQKSLPLFCVTSFMNDLLLYLIGSRCSDIMQWNINLHFNLQLFYIFYIEYKIYTIRTVTPVVKFVTEVNKLFPVFYCNFYLPRTKMLSLYIE